MARKFKDRRMSPQLRWLRALQVSLAVIPFVVGSISRADDSKWQIGPSIYHSSGDYGTGSTTTMTALPLSVRRLFQDGDITLVLMPYLSITSDCSVTMIGGVPNRTGGTCEPTTDPSKPNKPPKVRSSPVTERGIGDTILRGRYYLLDEQGWRPTLAVTAKIKFPTASRDQGLGTGEFDEGLGMELSKKFGTTWIGFADVSYTNLGDPPGLDLRNQWNYDFGVGYYFSKELMASLFYEEWTAVIPELQNPRDLLLALNYIATQTFRLNASLARGLSDGAPDWAFTAGVGIRF
jgi:hypothetical protein